MPLFAAIIACDVAGRLCFKAGADRLPTHHGPGRGDFYRGLLSDGWLLAGIAAFAGQFIIWVTILSMMPLSAAFPIATLAVLMAALAYRAFVSARLDAGQFAGVVLVMAGGHRRRGGIVSNKKGHELSHADL